MFIVFLSLCTVSRYCMVPCVALARARFPRRARACRGPILNLLKPLSTNRAVFFVLFCLTKLDNVSDVCYSKCVQIIIWGGIFVYLKNLNHRMTLRLDDDLLAFVSSASEIYGISPSDFIRQCISSVKYGYDLSRVQLNDKVSKGGSGNGFDRKEPINYQL